MKKYMCVQVTFQVILFMALGAMAMAMAGWMSPDSAITACILFQQLVKPSIDELYRFMNESETSTLKAKTNQDILESDFQREKSAPLSSLQKDALDE